MPKHIEIRENGLLVDIIVTDEGTVRLANFSLAEEPAPALQGESLQYSSLVEIKCTGEGYIHNHGQKHILTHTGHTAVYAGHRISRNACGAKAEFDLSAENGLFITCHFQFFDGIPIVRSWTQVQNRGTEDIGLEYVSSFLCHGLCRAGKQSFCEKATIYTPYTGWYNEFQWKKQNAEDLGLTRLPLSGYHSSGAGLNRYFYGSDTSWSSGEFLPMGILDDEETCQMYFWQIENSSGWLAEYGREPVSRAERSLRNHGKLVEKSAPRRGIYHCDGCVRHGKGRSFRHDRGADEIPPGDPPEKQRRRKLHRHFQRLHELS